MKQAPWECALSMGQHGQRGNALLKDAQIKFRKEDYALGMEQANIVQVEKYQDKSGAICPEEVSKDGAQIQKEKNITLVLAIIHPYQLHLLVVRM